MMTYKNTKNVFFLFLFFKSFFLFAQSDAIKEGNSLLSQKKYTEAEAFFRKELLANSTDLKLKNQLAFSLLSQNKYSEAEKLISEVLVKEPQNKAALWFGGLNNLNNKQGNGRKAMQYFEKVKPLLDASASSASLVDYYIGKSYKKMLYTEGLVPKEIDKMVESFNNYLKLQQKGEDVSDVLSFVNFINKTRNKKNLKKWILTEEDRGAEKQVNKFLESNKK